MSDGGNGPDGVDGAIVTPEVTRSEPDPAEVEELSAALEIVRGRIERAARRVGRDPEEVHLVAVSKLVPAHRVSAAIAAGQLELGENYVNELATKRAGLPGTVTWHYLGAVQSGTAAKVAELADVVHGLGSPGAARKLATRAAKRARVVRCLVQVDLAGRGTGIEAGELGASLDTLAILEGIDVIGLMTLPPVPEETADPEHARPWFRRLAALLDEQRPRHPGLRELSMGMSLDYEVAVEEGATMVRVGTALFGSRPEMG